MLLHAVLRSLHKSGENNTVHHIFSDAWKVMLCNTFSQMRGKLEDLESSSRSWLDKRAPPWRGDTCACFSKDFNFHFFNFNLGDTQHHFSEENIREGNA